MWNLYIRHMVHMNNLRLHEPYLDSWLHNWDSTRTNVDALKVMPVNMERHVVQLSAGSHLAEGDCHTMRTDSATRGPTMASRTKRQGERSWRTMGKEMGDEDNKRR